VLLDNEGATCCKDNKFILERFVVDEARNAVEVLGDSWNVEDRNALERCLLHRLFVAHDDTVEKREQIIGNAAARFTSLGQRLQNAYIRFFNLKASSLAPEAHHTQKRHLNIPSNKSTQ